MVNIKALRNRLYNGGMAAVAAVPIFGLAAYKVMDDLHLKKDVWKISRFVAVASIITGVLWALLPASRRNPSKEDRQVVKDVYGGQQLMQISYYAQKHDNIELREIHRRNNPDRYEKEKEEDRSYSIYDRYRRRDYDYTKKFTPREERERDEKKASTPFITTNGGVSRVKKISESDYKPSLTLQDLEELNEEP